MSLAINNDSVSVQGARGSYLTYIQQSYVNAYILQEIAWVL